ncbi:hypothetical protein GCM10022388_16650 [Flavobacterium chungnamense]|uniref:Uncharacterized protein n=1 Tax=Flavobacterium chungnamense TaxID=706182 RepID=A0ABP7US53_9FLAO
MHINLKDNLIHINQTISNSKKVAFLTFLVASILLLIFYFTEFNGMIYFSLLFIVAAFFVNTYLFVTLFFQLKQKQITNQILLTLGIMLLNIPIGYLYVEIGLKIYSHSNPN